MATWLRSLRQLFGKSNPERRPYRRTLNVEALEERQLLDAGFVQTNLLSDIPGLAQNTFNGPVGLHNAWGLVASPTSPFWLSNNGPGVSNLVTGNGTLLGLQVTIPPGASQPQGPVGSPTGLVFNGSNAFVVSENGNSGPAAFLFATEDGTISGWNFGVDKNNAILEVDNSANGANYTGLAIVNIGNTHRLYAANTAAGTIDVFNDQFKPITLAGNFTDPNLPGGYVPYNVQFIDDNIYVTYKQQGFNPVPGNGIVDAFGANGKFSFRLATGGFLNMPWGLAEAPRNFGGFGGDILVGNLGDGHIDAYSRRTHTFVGQLKDTSGNPLTIDGLWGLSFGNDHAAGSKDTLFFTAGNNGYADGLFGSLAPEQSNGQFGTPIIPNLTPSNPQQISTTIPSNGDVNPYGIAYVPQGFAKGTGPLNPGDLLISNFNAGPSNFQGTGTTIVRVTPDGHTTTFFQGSGLGLTTGLGILKSGFVIVGNMPTTDGTAGTLGPTSLLVIDSSGHQVGTISDPSLLNGPWDLTVNDQGSTAQIFVANVVSGTVTRVDVQISGGVLSVVDKVQIGSGYMHKADAIAFELGPTGLAYDATHDILYVASTLDNEIFAIANAGTTLTDGGTGTVAVNDNLHLHGPLGLVLAPNGDLITANGDAVNTDLNHPSEIAEFTPTGTFVGQISISPNVDGAFGIALEYSAAMKQFHFAAVNDNTNSVEVWDLNIGH